MSKRPTPKKQRSNAQSKRQYKEFQNRSRKKLMGKVDFMKKLQKNPNYQALQRSAGENRSGTVTRVQA